MKILNVLLWVGILLIKLIAFIYSLFIFPIAYIFKTKIRKSIDKNNSLLNPSWWLWITLDDENDYGEPWYLEHNNLKENFTTAWLWSYLRNNSWNLNQLMKLKTDKEVFLSGYTTSSNSSPLEHCRFKWEMIDTTTGKITDGWDVNQGNRLSQKYSSEGTSFCWYKTPYKIVFRYSYAGVVLNLLMINTKSGFNKRGEALFDIKISRYKSYYKEHWVY